jgi:hypothetical protein
MAAMPSCALDLLFRYFASPPLNMLAGTQGVLHYDSAGADYLAACQVCRNLHRHAVTAVAMRMLCLAARRREQLYRERAEQHLRRLDRALLHLEDIDDDRMAVLERVRTTVCLLQVERQTLAVLLNRHPQLRDEAYDIRVDATEIFSEDGDSNSDGEP